MSTDNVDDVDLERGMPIGSGISERFLSVAGPAATSERAELLPTALALAVVDVTAADGAGLSVLSRDFRVPLGASSRDAAAIERLQFTAEQGPCWDAIHADLPLSADHDHIVERWPLFADELHAATAYRSVVSAPVRLARGVGGAMDLYFTDPAGAGRFDLHHATVIAAHIADYLNRADGTDRPVDQHGLTGPAWARGAPARGRLAVWIAVGMVLGDAVTLPADALAVLRAAAYSAGRSLDEVAGDLVEGRITVGSLLPS